MQTQQQNYSSPIRPQVKAADLMFQNTFASMMTANEVMKPILLLFNGFHRTGICQIIFNPIQDGRKRKCKTAPH